MPAHRPEDAHLLFVDAFNRQDLETLVSLYEPHAVLCNREGKPIQGREAIRQAFANMLASEPQMRLQTRYAIAMGDVALLRSDWEITARDNNGPAAKSRRHSSTEVVRRQADGTWQYVIDHPFGGD